MMLCLGFCCVVGKVDWVVFARLYSARRLVGSESSGVAWGLEYSPVSAATMLYLIFIQHVVYTSEQASKPHIYLSLLNT